MYRWTTYVFHRCQHFKDKNDDSSKHQQVYCSTELFLQAENETPNIAAPRFESFPARVKVNVEEGSGSSHLPSSNRSFGLLQLIIPCVAGQPRKTWY